MTVLALSSGSERAPRVQDFRELYEANFNYVWRVLARLGVPDRDLADAVQDVFVVVHRKLADFDGRCRLTTWLYGICFRIASDRRRAAQARYESFEDPPEIRGSLMHGDDHAAGTAHYRKLLDSALDAMPLEQRAVFAFFELDGLSGEEIALRVGVPVATVHSRLRLARLAFRKFLERIDKRELFIQQHSGGKP